METKRRFPWVARVAAPLLFILLASAIYAAVIKTATTPAHGTDDARLEMHSALQSAAVIERTAAPTAYMPGLAETKRGWECQPGTVPLELTSGGGVDAYGHRVVSVADADGVGVYFGGSHAGRFALAGVVNGHLPFVLADTDQTSTAIRFDRADWPEGIESVALCSDVVSPQGHYAQRHVGPLPFPVTTGRFGWRECPVPARSFPLEIGGAVSDGFTSYVVRRLPDQHGPLVIESTDGFIWADVGIVNGYEMFEIPRETRRVILDPRDWPQELQSIVLCG